MFEIHHSHLLADYLNSSSNSASSKINNSFDSLKISQVLNKKLNHNN